MPTAPKQPWTQKQILLDNRTAELRDYRRNARLNIRARQRAIAKIKTELRRIKLGKV